ncbi:MAG: EF-P beta-lysylation protein EpmB [Thioalkalivibrio sp.]|nr:EF-P beta-lysylation protein EpmB [Thioalkalivibrio sp.]
MPTNRVMIPLAAAPAQTPAWQQALARAIADPRELLRRLGLEPSLLKDMECGDTLFRTRVPESYFSRIRPNDPRDPLLLQVLPQAAEADDHPAFVTGPVGDGGAFPYGEFSAVRDWQPALDYITGQVDVTEVILSGGDPLTLPDARLANLLRRLEAIPHVRRLRIHTRLPIVLPERVDDGLLSWLGQGRLGQVMVLHANHPREFEAPVDDALARLRATGITLLNQSVLLAGVNDDIDTLCELQEAGFAAGVLPYYLHLLDRVKGASHFEVDEARARALHEAMRVRLPGYLLPRLVREIPGTPYKTPTR